MVEDLINNIKSAEEKADENIRDSVKKAKEIAREAEENVIAMNKQCSQDIQAMLKGANDEGKQLAEEAYSKVMFEAHKKCEDIKEVALSNESKAIEYVARGLFDKYGSR